MTEVKAENVIISWLKDIYIANLRSILLIKAFQVSLQNMCIFYDCDFSLSHFEQEEERVKISETTLVWGLITHFVRKGE